MTTDSTADWTVPDIVGKCNRRRPLPPTVPVGRSDVQPEGRSALSERPIASKLMADTHHLSQAAYDRLAEEYQELSTRGRVDIARKIEAARELGDLSENGDYHAAKEEQGKMEARIRHLDALLKDAQIVAGGGSEIVAAGSIVEIRFEGDDETERYLIGSIEERHDDLEVISPGSPLGQALLGRDRWARRLTLSEHRRSSRLDAPSTCRAAATPSSERLPDHRARRQSCCCTACPPPAA